MPSNDLFVLFCHYYTIFSIFPFKDLLEYLGHVCTGDPGYPDTIYPTCTLRFIVKHNSHEYRVCFMHKLLDKILIVLFF